MLPSAPFELEASAERLQRHPSTTHPLRHPLHWPFVSLLPPPSLFPGRPLAVSLLPVFLMESRWEGSLLMPSLLPPGSSARVASYNGKERYGTAVMDATS